MEKENLRANLPEPVQKEKVRGQIGRNTLTLTVNSMRLGKPQVPCLYVHLPGSLSKYLLTK